MAEKTVYQTKNSFDTFIANQRKQMGLTGTTTKAGDVSGATQGHKISTKSTLTDPLPKLPNIMDPAITQPQTGITIKSPNDSGVKTKSGDSASMSSSNITGNDPGLYVANAVSSAIIENNRGNSLNSTQAGVQDAIMKGIDMYNPVAGALVRGLNAVQYATNSQVDAVTKEQSKAVGQTTLGRYVNNTAATLPGTFLGRLYGATNDAYVSAETKASKGAFADSVNDTEIAQSIGGRNILTGRLKFNNFINDANYVNDIITEMKRTNTTGQQKAAASANDIASRNNRMQAQTSLRGNAMGKNGMKLMSVAEAKKLLNSKKITILEDSIAAFQNGGIIGVDTNILPEGALHAHKNNLEDVNEEIGSKVTEKGIPVVFTDSEGNVEQCAEIEREELLVRKFLTDKLEELRKKNDDEALIEAGKLLAEELITNTQDNTGQLEDN